MSERTTATAPTGRWVQLWLGVLCMVLIANLQYAWTLFVDPIHQAHGWTIAQIQVAFSIFIATETWLTPIQGYIVDRLGPSIGPRLMIVFGGVLVGLAWVINAYANSLEMLYVGAGISGVGAGGIYATCVGNAVKWFPDRRGLAVGLTAAGFGAGAALTVVPIRLVIEAYGYTSAFFWFGLLQGVILLFVAQVMRGPTLGTTLPHFVRAEVPQSVRSYTSGEVLRSPAFWLLYVMFVLVSASGLMATAQLAPIAKDFGLSNTAILFGATTLSVALVVDNVMNGLARPFFGAVSDRIGREYTMALAFSLGALSYWLLTVAGDHPLDVRALRRADLLHLGRNFFPVPLHLHRPVRHQVRDGQCNAALYGQRHIGVSGAVRQRAEVRDRRLGRGVPGCGRDECAGGHARPFRAASGPRPASPHGGAHRPAR
jgi:MFS transporter, OFA family, oxalate/formate antiporter